MQQAPAHRPPSIRSVASNSSIASAVSLSRRPRTRARSRTVTGASNRPDEPPLSPAIPSDLPYLNGPIVQEPIDDIPAVPPIPLSPPPERPPKSPQRLESQEIRGSDTASSQGGTAVDVTVVEPLPVAGKPAKAALVAANLPQLNTGYQPPPSAFSRDPALTPVVNVRDSVSTQQSGTSSSLYPPSTSTASGPESPISPQFMEQHFDSIQSVSFSPEVNELQEYDSDDVSYRLRLLVKNNYFLPPAHSKPSLADLAHLSLDPSKVSSKPSTPTFLDIFRIGKSKSKPTTPTGAAAAFDLGGPILRTTSDSITAGHALHTQDPRLSAQMPRLSPHLPNTAPRGRVVVVREKMNDLLVAAKQAEQDLKTRGVRVETGSQKAKPEAEDDVIDPTDAVDIPLPSASYPFAMQTSAIHGLGVLESVGADVLADRLPPNQSGSSSAEDSWRKALLQQAVHHSLDNTPDVSTFSHVLGASTPLGSPRSKPVDAPRVASPLTQQQLINQKILDQPTMDGIASSSPAGHKRQKSGQSQTSMSKGNSKGKLTVFTANTSNDSSRPASYLPQRVDTPSGPMTPLGPAPRRPFASQASFSQTDLADPPHSPQSFSTFESTPRIRRTLSSPQLADGYHSSSSLHDVKIADMPPYPRDSQITVTTVDTVRGSYKTLNGSGSLSHHPESDHEDEPRQSLSLSIPISRPSISEYSQASMSPTTSTFQDMLNHEDHSVSSHNPGPSRFSVEQQSAMRGTPPLRYSAMSPPPRISSSLAHVALPPPPRSSSLNYRAQMSSVLSTSTSGSSLARHVEAVDTTFQIVEPGPSTPPLPEQRSPSSRIPLSLNIPNASVNIAPSIHSAPGPTSPTSFFDSIQTQPNAMDDLDSSSDESEDEEPAAATQQTRSSFADSRSRVLSNASAGNSKPLIMRHGNFSTPYIRSGESYHPNLLPIGHNASSKQPVSNTPLRLSRQDTLPSSSYDFFKYAQDHPATAFSAPPTGSRSAVRPATADNVANWRINQKAQESLRKLDGLLIQHMEDEKDTLKRIATTMKHSPNA